MTEHLLGVTREELARVYRAGYRNGRWSAQLGEQDRPDKNNPYAEKED